jgi:hypothetical protein
MAQRFVDHVVLGIPIARLAVERHDLSTSNASAQLMLQELLKKRMIAIPVSWLIKPQEEEIQALKALEGGVAICEVVKG